MMQNFDIELNNVKIPKSNRVEQALDFNKGTKTILKHSRLYVAWLAIGGAAGALEAAF